MCKGEGRFNVLNNYDVTLLYIAITKCTSKYQHTYVCIRQSTCNIYRSVRSMFTSYSHV